MDLRSYCSCYEYEEEKHLMGYASFVFSLCRTCLHRDLRKKKQKLLRSKVVIERNVWRVINLAMVRQMELEQDQWVGYVTIVAIQPHQTTKSGASFYDQASTND